MKEKFDLSYLPTNYSEVFREFRVNGLVDNSVLAEVLAQITGAQLTYSQKVVRLLDITPEQLDKPREEFCLFFPQSRSCVLSTGVTTTVPPQTGEPAR